MAYVATTIWLDQTGTRDSQCYIDLCKIDPYLVSFRDVQKSIDYITKLKDNGHHIILIISVNELTIQEYVEQLPVESIYILYNSTMVHAEEIYKCSKIRGIYTERHALCNALSLLPCIKRQRRDDFQRMDFIVTSLSEDQLQLERSTTDLDQNVLEYLIFKTLRDVLLEETDSSQNEMIAFCRQKYADSPTDLNNVEEFEEYYQSSVAIFWYTREIFLYRLVNKALREQDIETIYSLRYFIHHLYQRLQERYAPQQSSCQSMVYRGQLMNNEEFNRKIRNNIGGFFSINSFLSTTENESLAAVYAGINNLPETSKEQGVLFKIPIDTNIDKFSYANISNESALGDAESEVLFTMGVIFRITSVTRDDNANAWSVLLKISDEEETHLHLINSIIKNDLMKPYPSLIRLIKFLWNMQYLEQAKHFLLIALDDTSITSNLNLLSLVYYQLGIIYKLNKQLSEAKSSFKNALNIKYNSGDASVSLSNIYTNLGTVYENLGDLYEAHICHNQAFQILLNIETVDQADLALKYSNIASVCLKKEYYVEALNNYKNCLQIELEIYANDDDKKELEIYANDDDKKLLITKNNIGVVYIYLEKYTEAIQYFQEMIETEENSSRNRSTNQNLALAYWNMACALYRQRQFEKALEYSEKCQHILTADLVIIFHEPEAKECQEWIERIRNDCVKQPIQIRKGYGPEPWRIVHPYRPTFDLD